MLPHSLLALAAAVPAALLAVEAPPSAAFRGAALGIAAVLAWTALAPGAPRSRAAVALALLVYASASPTLPVASEAIAPGLYRVEGRVTRVDPPRAEASASGALVDDAGRRVEVRVDGAPPPWRAGERWSVLGRAALARPLANFDAKPPAREVPALHCSAASMQRMQATSFAFALAEDVRAELTRRIERLFPEAQRGLASALLLGHGRAIEPEQRERLRATGTAHLIAVSGAHVMLFLALPHFALRRARRRWRVLVLAALVPSYTLLTGGAAPVRRAAVLVATRLACEVLGRPHRGLDALCWAAVIELCIAPAQIVDLSFLLSYLAVAGLLVALHDAPAPTTWRKKLELSLRVGLGATAATLPLLHATFGSFSPHTLWLSPLGSPMLAVSMAVGYGALVAEAAPLAWCAAQPLALFDAILAFADRLEGTPIALDGFPVFGSVALGAGVLCFVAGWRRPALLLGAIALGAAFFSQLALRAAEPPPRFFVEVLDVGHGTCVILGEPGGRVALFDAGSQRAPRSAARSLVARLAHHRAREIAFVAISHGDDDHRNLLRLAEGLPAIRTLIGPEGCAGADQELRSGTLRFAIGEALLELHAPRARTSAPANDRSLWLSVRIHEHRFFFFGDPDWLGLAEVIEELESPCDALLWPHHGRTLAGGRALLERTRPRAIWVSDELDRRLEGIAGDVPVLSTTARGALLWTIEADGTARFRAARDEPRE